MTSFITALRKIQYLGMNLKRELKDLYKENYSSLEKGNWKWQDVSCSWIGRISLVKMAILPQLSYRLIAIPIKMLTALFKDPEKNNPI